jgi:ATP-dependent exoDNAse (exonuclease V) beta subunit
VVFNHVKSELQMGSIEQVNGEKFRTYVIDGVKEYPSITSVLASQDKPFLERWKKRVGHAQAEMIKNQSANVGTALHELTEQYLLNRLDIKKFMPNIRDLFLSYKPYINRIDNIRILETFLYSDELMIAGTVDCVAEFDGKLSIIDFKNARRPKKLEWVQDYFTQCTFYAKAFEERTGEKVEQLVLPISVWDSEPQLFTDQVKQERITKIRTLRDNFRLTHSI